MISRMSAARVVGREEEVAAIRSLVGGQAGRGVVLNGEAGIGKTVLWELGVELAAESGSRVLGHRGAVAETALAFSGLADLLGPLVADVLPELAPPRRRALEVALRLAEPEGTGTPDPLTIGLAALDALRAVAANGPVLLAIDDLQWLDASSASVLGLALRRLGPEPVVVLATMRTGATGAEPLPGAGLELMALEPLDLTGLHRLLRDRLGLELPRPTLAVIHRASGGNPYFALELARDPPSGPTVRVPDSLRDLLGRRVERLSPGVRSVLLDVAALAQPTVALVTAGRDDADDARAALGVAVEEGILRVEEERIRFAHPLLASISYDRALPWERQAAHARLAALVADPEERARHRALSVGEATDEELAAELELAGGRAAERGATAAAAELLDLAVRHTPSGCVEQTLRRRIAAAGFHHLAGDLERAYARYEGLRADLPPGPQRARILQAMALTNQSTRTESIALGRQALVEAGDDDGLAAQLLALIAICRWRRGETEAALTDARSGLARAERAGVPLLEAGVIATVAVLETWFLEQTPGLLERGVRLERALAQRAPLPFAYSPMLSQALRLILQDGVDEARDLVEELAAAAERHGDEQTRTYMAMLRLNLERSAGHPRRAIVHAEIARDLAEQVADAHFRVLVLSSSAGAHAEAGLLDDAERLASDGLERARSLHDVDDELILLGTLGRVRLLRGDAAGAHELLDELPERLLQAGHLHPAGTPWADAIEAALAVGRTQRAEHLLREYDSLAARSSRWARASAARCNGLLRVALHDTDGAIAAFESALVEEAGTYPLERGRILLGLGTAHRHARHSRAARETLDQAVALLEEIGAAAWRDQAAAELARVSGRRRHGDALTPSELRVAELAAEGRQNKEIAGELFLSVGTVEAHLSRVYRKLGVRSRTELAKELAKTGGAASNV